MLFALEMVWPSPWPTPRRRPIGRASLAGIRRAADAGRHCRTGDGPDLDRRLRDVPAPRWLVLAFVLAGGGVSLEIAAVSLGDAAQRISCRHRATGVCQSAVRGLQSGASAGAMPESPSRGASRSGLRRGDRGTNPRRRGPHLPPLRRAGRTPADRRRRHRRGRISDAEPLAPFKGHSWQECILAQHALEAARTTGRSPRTSRITRTPTTGASSVRRCRPWRGASTCSRYRPQRTMIRPSCRSR